MDANEEFLSNLSVNGKKWFVLSEDERVGPFTAEELESKFDSNSLSENDFIWCEGFEGWKTIKDFKLGKQAPPIFRDPRAKSIKNFQTEGQHKKDTKKGTPTRELKKLDLDLAIIGMFLRFKRRLKTPVIRNFWVWICAVTLATSFILSLGYQSAQEFFQKRRIHTLEALTTDVSLEERRELRAAMTEPLAEFGPSVALGVSKQSSRNPFFLITTNLPDSTRFDLLVEGIPDTLIGNFRIYQKATVSVKSGMVSSSVFQSEGGAAFPQGEYRITIVDSAGQSEEVESILKKYSPHTISSAIKIEHPVRVIAQKKYFLGGLKNEEYDQKLSSYHAEMKEKSKAEQLELGQYVAILEDQLNETVSKYSQVFQREGVDKEKQKKLWTVFDDRWSKLQNKLNHTMESWTPEWLEKHVFYAKSYLMVQKAAQLVSRAHGYQNKIFLESGTQVDSMDVQTAETVSLARSALFSARAKIVSLEKKPDTANGMPRAQ